MSLDVAVGRRQSTTCNDVFQTVFSMTIMDWHEEWRWPQDEDNLRNEDDLKMVITLTLSATASS